MTDFLPSFPSLSLSLSLSVSSLSLSPLSLSLPLSQGSKAVADRTKKQRDSKPKVRKLKYHQYIPPDQQKTEREAPPPLDSAYSRLLHQQQLFLQLQIISQQQHSNYQTILPAPPRPPGDQQGSSTSGSSSAKKAPPSQPPSTNTNTQNHHALITIHLPPLPPNLEELKVAELKQELKIRGLTVSGTKNDLIERLKNFHEQNGGSEPPSTPSTGGSNTEVRQQRSAASNTSTSQPPLQQQPPVQSSASTTILHQPGMVVTTLPLVATVGGVRAPSAIQPQMMQFGSVSSSPPLSPTHSEQSLAGMSPDDHICNGDAFGEMVTSPLTQLSLQPSPPTPPTVHIVDESPPATRGPSHPFLAAAPPVDKDWMLQEKDRRIAELTRMLQQKQQLVDRLRSQLQDQQTGDVTFMPHLPITVKEEPQDIPMEEVEEMQAEQQQQEQQQRQKELEKLILQQNQLNLRKQTQHRRKKTHKQQVGQTLCRHPQQPQPQHNSQQVSQTLCKQPQPQHNSQQVGQTLCKHLQQLQPQHNSQQVGQTLCRHPQQPQPQHNSQQVGQTLCRHPQQPQPQHNSQQVGQKLCKHPQQPQPQPQHNSQQVGQTVCKHHQQQARHTSQQVSQVFTSHQSGAPSSLPVNGIKSGSSRTLLTDNNGNHFLQKLANHNTDNKANNGPQNKVTTRATPQRQKSTPSKLPSQSALQMANGDIQSKQQTICKQPLKKALKPEKHGSTNHMKARSSSFCQSSKVQPFFTMESVSSPVHTPSDHRKSGRTQRIDDLFDILVQSGEISANFKPTPDPALSRICANSPPLSPSPSPLHLSPPTPCIPDTPLGVPLEEPPAQEQFTANSCSTTNPRLEDFLESTTGKPLLGVEPGGHVTLIDELHSQLLSTPSILDHPSSPMDTYEFGLSSSRTGLELAESALDSMDWLDLGIGGSAGDGPCTVALNGHAPTSVFSTDFLDSSDLHLHWDC
ncbi:hypothetical protein NFI96_012143 [Prochilodus magdalenae]|nr:hypothetical protein NFI96_012143 [Prochilodus magdalenae]